MRKSTWFLMLGGFALACLLCPMASAQNAVCNPFFSTMDLQHWDGTDPSLICVPGSIDWGMSLYCCRKNPGSTANNGSITQAVHLIGGMTYDFSCNIASTYICPG